ERNVLTVKAERSWWPDEGAEVLAPERTQGTFSRQVLLGEALDPEHVEAWYEDGVLRVTIPVLEKAKPRKVEIQSGEAQSSEVASTNPSRLAVHDPAGQRPRPIGRGRGAFGTASTAAHARRDHPSGVAPSWVRCPRRAATVRGTGQRPWPITSRRT